MIGIFFHSQGSTVIVGVAILFNRILDEIKTPVAELEQCSVLKVQAEINRLIIINIYTPSNGIVSGQVVYRIQNRVAENPYWDWTRTGLQNSL